MGNCRVCGEENAADAMFCGICGSPISLPEEPVGVQKAAEEKAESLDPSNLSGELKALREEIARLKTIQQEASSLEDTIRETLKDYFASYGWPSPAEISWQGYGAASHPIQSSGTAKPMVRRKRPRLDEAISRAGISGEVNK